jgi:hypothetical protein
LFSHLRIPLSTPTNSDEQCKRREAYIYLGIKPSDILSHPDDDENPTPSQYAKYGETLLLAFIWIDF